MHTVLEDVVDFADGCTKDCWVDSIFHLFVFAAILEVNIVWFDMNNDITYACIRKKENKKLKDNVINRHGYIFPEELCEGSIW